MVDLTDSLPGISVRKDRICIISFDHAMNIFLQCLFIHRVRLFVIVVKPHHFSLLQLFVIYCRVKSASVSAVFVMDSLLFAIASFMSLVVDIFFNFLCVLGNLSQIIRTDAFAI